MAKRRMVDGKIRSSQTFAKLTWRQKDLWHGLIEVVDDQGRLPGQPSYVRSQVWPYEDVAIPEIESDLKRLEELCFIFRYEVLGAVYLQLINWHYYQRDAEWLGESDYPPAPGWVDHARYHGKGGKPVMISWETRLHPPSLLTGLPDTLPPPLPPVLPTCLPQGDGNGNVDGNGDDEGESSGKPNRKKDDPELVRAIEEILNAWLELFPDKPKPRPTTYRSKIRTRLQNPDFVSKWRKALETASKSPACQNESWFDFEFFIRNDENYQKMLDRWMEWKDVKEYGVPARPPINGKPKSELTDAEMQETAAILGLRV